MIVLANDRSTEISERPKDAGGLWIRTDELEEATGWQIKNQGACLGEICVPLLADERANWIENDEGGEWFEYSRLADKLGQKYVSSGDVWSLGIVPESRRSTIESGIAPDFEVTDRNGDTFKLSDLRGKKVLIVTWATW